MDQSCVARGEVKAGAISLCLLVMVSVPIFGAQPDRPVTVEPNADSAGQQLPSAPFPAGSVVTTNTKQVYRFHFSGLQSADAVRLAQQLWPFVAKLPAENPLRNAVLQAKDIASFADDYRSLRSSFMDSGIDTIYFVAEDHWIEATTLPGYVVMPGTPATLKRLQERLTAAGHTEWAKFLTGFRPVAGTPGWMSCEQGPVTASGARLPRPPWSSTPSRIAARSRRPR